MEVKILPRRPAGAGGDTSSQVPLEWIKIKKCPFPDWNPALSWRECHRKVCIIKRLRPDHGVGSVKEISKSDLHIVFFLYFGRPPLLKMVRWASWRGVQFLPSNNQVCRKKSPNKEFNSNIWFSTCSFSSEK